MKLFKNVVCITVVSLNIINLVSTFDAPNDLVTFAPSKNPEVMCYSKILCKPFSSCLFRARLLSSKKNTRYSGGVEAQAYCEGLKARIQCPQGNQVMCSDARKCYVYEPSNPTSYYRFHVLEIVVRKPKAAVSQIECDETKYKTCPVFEENNTTIGFVAGMNESCVSKTKFISDNGVFLPPSAVFCESYELCYPKGSCQCQENLVSNGVDRFSSDQMFTIACWSLTANISCSFQDKNKTNSMCSVVKKCYNYHGSFYNFDVMVLDFKKVSSKMSNATREIQCNVFGETNGKCPVFLETESKVKFVIGFPEYCRPL